jgi:hypothetical protein
MRRNASENPASCQVQPNGFYQAYRHLFDKIFLQSDFEGDELRDLYVFDRCHYTRERFQPRTWSRVELQEDLVLSREFDIPPTFGQYERELLSFLMVDVKGKLLRIIGNPGTGKSSFLKLMLETYLPQQRFIGNERRGRIITLDLSKALRVRKHYNYAQTANLLIRHLAESVQSKSFPTRAAAGWDEQQLINWLRQEVEHHGANRVMFAIDNVDVFHPSFQDNLWVIADSLCRSTGCTVILCMRPINSRYFDSPAAGASSVHYDMDQRAPVLSAVIKRRLKYFVQNSRDFRQDSHMRIGANPFWVTFEDVEEFVNSFLRIILNDRVQTALENLTNFNVKLGLLWTLRFASSWNLNVPAMVKRLVSAASLEAVPEPIDSFDSLIAALGLGNHSIYFPQSSCLENLFSAQLKRQNADLLIKYRVLKYCAGVRGDVAKTQILEHLTGFGYSQNEIATTIDALVKPPRRLLESRDGDGFHALTTLRIAHSGVYYLSHLVHNILYIQIVADDIEIPESLFTPMTRSSSKYERIKASVDFIRLVGEKEISDAARFLQSSNEINGNREAYEAIYGRELLSTDMLKSVRIQIVRRYRREKSSRSQAKWKELLDQTTQASVYLSSRFRQVFGSAS